MTYFTKRPSWAYEYTFVGLRFFFERLTKVSSFF